MTQTEPDFWVLEYVTITRDPRTDLVVAFGGTEQAADILQRTGGFLSAPGPRDHRLPHGLPVEQQRLKATATSHALLAAGHSVYLDPALNMLVVPDGEREAALRYLAGLAERAATATTGSEVAEVLTEVAAPVQGLLPLVREVVVRVWIAADDFQEAAPLGKTDPLARLGSTAASMSEAARAILHARNHAARSGQRHGHCLTTAGGPRPACGIAPPLTAENLTANLADGCGKDVETYIKALKTNRFPPCLQRRPPHPVWRLGGPGTAAGPPISPTPNRRSP
ncbi:hypothetical protein AB0D59_32250 [Streptomyces sp. NPDC048417]|uniref:hypothetical protein n=1 Tax=Streptomyces sp. NPDC048417 TaxID=3155387 RepID=UPI003442FFB5